MLIIHGTLNSRAARPARSSATEANASMLGDPPRPAPKTVLVVEDNELNPKLLNDLLEYQGIQ